MEEIWNARRVLEKEYKYREWIEKIPFIELPRGYQIKPIPNFAGSVVRFLASKKGGKKSVSIYLDCYEELGSYNWGENDEPIPYWEVYPVDGSNYRCQMNETDKLIKAIIEGLKDENKPSLIQKITKLFKRKKL
jgi:hypothetical protein